MKSDPSFVLRPPRVLDYEPNVVERQAIAVYLKQIIGGRTAEIQKNLPTSMPLWGKVRILSGGDAIRSHFAAGRQTAKPVRDSSYIRFEVEYEEHSNIISLVNYGRLERIIVCSLPNNHFWRDLAGRTIIIVLVTPCQTNGTDATQGFTSYNRKLATIATDLRNVKAVVGRFKTRGEWVIIDRSGAYAQPLFDPEADSGEENEG
ncbi:hypothetical protein BU15DRAFT_56778 [Melanogaster broomeanus]|nr:hypothetical protein BU15DRAFT_56778 [Melanogaster broomeanus]